MHRDRPPAESLTEFRRMRDGHYAAGEAVLRMKQHLASDNLQVWDLAAYRIPEKKTPHHRTGTQWRFYHSYIRLYSLSLRQLRG